MNQDKSAALDYIDRHSAKFTAIADDIWNFAELRFEEFASTERHIEVLEAAGFRVTRGLAGIPTAFVAEAGEGGPVIGILGEYDALSGLSQEAAAFTCTPSAEISNGNGHGCGHHLLGTAAHLGAAAVKAWLEANDLPGRVRFYGCPAEEGGSGKTFMARAGAFDDLDAALSWHPAVHNGVWSGSTLANIQAYFRFHGRASHAAGSPHLGRSALDAVELMNVGVNYLREHMLPAARVHYATTNTGGTSPNVVQAEAEVLYLVRAPENSDAVDLFERVKDVAKGAALMTGCRMEVVFDKACSNLLLNSVLNRVVHQQLETLGVPAFSDGDVAYAREVQERTLSATDIEDASRSLGEAMRNPAPLFGHAIRFDPSKEPTLYGSTDVGDVSWITPTAQCMTACYAFGTPFHSWQLVAQGKSSFAHKGMLAAARTLTASAIELFAHPEILAEAKDELLRRRQGKPYICPIPEEVTLPFAR